VNPPSQEPRDGDFVAYLDALEKRQLAALRIQHTLASAGATSKAEDTDEAERPASGRTDADAPPQRMQTKNTTATAGNGLPAGIVVALIVGAVLAFSGLFGDGGPFLLLVGLALLVYGVRRLMRFRRGVPDRARQKALQRVASLIDAARKR
jgi:hypothetical protein